MERIKRNCVIFSEMSEELSFSEDFFRRAKIMDPKKVTVLFMSRKTPEELKASITNGEIGFCEDEKRLYYKDRVKEKFYSVKLEEIGD